MGCSDLSAAVPPKAFLTRADRRRMERLATKVGRVTDADAAFFERFPKRRYRVRLASPAEIETDAILKGEPDTSTTTGVRWVTIVRQIIPGVRFRVVERSIGRDGNDLDLPEELARWAYEQMVVPGSYAFEQEQKIAKALAQIGECR